MQTQALSLGVILLIVGGIAFAAGYVNSQAGETVGGSLERSISGTEEQNYQTYQVMQWGGGIAALIGVVLAVSAAFAGSKGKYHA